MKVSFSTLACPDWEWKKIINEAARLGYDGIELRCIERELDIRKMKPFYPENLENTIRQLKQRNLEICCLDTSCKFHNKAGLNKYLDEGKAAIDLAQKLGCKYIRVFGDDIPDKEKEEETIKQIAAGINTLGEYATEKDVIVLIESHGKFSRADTMKMLLYYITNEAVKVLWDITNAYVDYGEPLEETFSILCEYIRHVHIKDAKGKYPDAKLCMIGKGDLLLGEVITLLKSSGYDGWLSFEWEKMWQPELEEPEVALEVYIEYIHSLFE